VDLGNHGLHEYKRGTREVEFETSFRLLGYEKVESPGGVKKGKELS